MAQLRRRWTPLITFLLVVALAGSAVTIDWVAFRHTPPQVAPLVLVPGITPIRRVVVIMKENHGFDNYFGTFPGADGIPSNVSLPDGSGGQISPHWINGTRSLDPPHMRSDLLADYDGGRNDLFAVVSNTAFPGLASATMGYYDRRQLQGYWTLAGDFTLADRYFSPIFGPTLPNRLYSIAGQSGGILTNTIPLSGLDLPTVFDQLASRGITWRYYAFSDVTIEPLPLHIRHIAANASMTSNVVPLGNLAGDIADGNLPSVTYVDPNGDLPSDLAINEHPPGDVASGQAWSMAIIGAIMASPLWSSTAIFLTWDESGGFYDHVPPPQVDSLGYGFRVPLLIISPYAKRGFIDHEAMDHTSLLKFIATNWGLPPLTPREGNASDVMSAFAFPPGVVKNTSLHVVDGFVNSRTPRLASLSAPAITSDAPREDPAES